VLKAYQVKNTSPVKVLENKNEKIDGEERFVLILMVQMVWKSQFRFARNVQKKN